MSSPFLYFADDRLSTAELTAARLDGDLVDLGDAFIPADAVETTALRAGSLRQVLGNTLAATHLTAAWVHGARHEQPAQHWVQRAVPQRLHHVMGARLVYRDRAIEHGDLVRVGGVLVTNPVRTVADLARVATDEHVEAVLSFVAMAPHVLPGARDWIAENHRLPHARRAARILGELLATAGEGAAQEDVTR